MIKTCKSGGAAHEYWVHVSERSVPQKVSKSHCRCRIFGNGLANISWSFMTSLSSFQWSVPNNYFTVWFKNDFLMYAKSFDNLDNSLSSCILEVGVQKILQLSSRRADVLALYEHSLNVIFVMNVSILLLRRSRLASHIVVSDWCVCTFSSIWILCCAVNSEVRGLVTEISRRTVSEELWLRDTKRFKSTT